MTDPEKIIDAAVNEMDALAGAAGAPAIRALTDANFAIADLSTHVIVRRDDLKVILTYAIQSKTAIDTIGQHLRAMLNHKGNALSVSKNAGPRTNTGHGHVWERPDGVKAKCGGPGLCEECWVDLSTYGKDNAG